MRSLIVTYLLCMFMTTQGQKENIESTTLDLRYTDITTKEKQPTFIGRVSYLSNDRIWIDNNMTMRPFKEQLINTLVVGYKLKTGREVELIPYIGMRHEFNNTAGTNDASIQNEFVIGSRFQYCWREKHIRFTLRRIQVNLGKELSFDARSQIDYTFSAIRLRTGIQFDTKTTKDNFSYLGGLTISYKPKIKKSTWLQVGVFTNGNHDIGFQLRTIMSM